MKTVYYTTSGQNIRQQQDLNNNTIIIKRKVIQSRLIDARSSFTNENFDVSLEGLKETAKEWAYNPDLLKFDVSHEVIETPKQSHVGEYERQLASAEATVETFIVKL